MSDQEEHAPSAPVSEIGDDELGSDAEQAFSAHKRRKTGLTKCEDEYAVSQQREARRSVPRPTKVHLLDCVRRRLQSEALRKQPSTVARISCMGFYLSRCWLLVRENL